MTYQSGCYIVEFNNSIETEEFIAKYSVCPLWILVQRIDKSNSVFILAREIQEQKHGDFDEENNTLVKHPEYLGAKKVCFSRTESLTNNLKRAKISYGQSEKNPCGSDCSSCKTFQNPCLGCAANKYYFYEYSKM